MKGGRSRRLQVINRLVHQQLTYPDMRGQLRCIHGCNAFVKSAHGRSVLLCPFREELLLQSELNVCWILSDWINPPITDRYSFKRGRKIASIEYRIS